MPTLNWIGKEAVVKHHKEVPFRLLEPVAELSCATVHPSTSSGRTEEGVWAALSGGRCHFVMVRNKEWDVIDAEISKVSA